MKLCRFCGCKTDNSNKTCASCGSQQFLYICPNCSGEFEGKFCPTCGTRYDAVVKSCPECGQKYFSNSCPNCGYNEFENSRPLVQTSFSRAQRANQMYGGPVDGLVILALVMSILGLATCMFPFSLVGLIISIAQTRKQKSGFADVSDRVRVMTRASLIVSIIGVTLTVLSALLYVVALIYQGSR